MTSPNKLNFGSIEIYDDQVLGVGSYGKVCKAKYGQLPCAAKLLHDTMFETGDPGIFKFAERFEQECQFLSMIKHPNIVQYLGMYRNPQTQRLALLMELMDGSLTNFLERSTGPLPYHTPLNICHDVALALSYLHSNTIVHRDLSSNNVLLIGEGSRAKVTDFGMSKLMDMNPRMTPLTVCPGATVYMPPEALTTPPHYSSKLDCFSHGVLTIQIITRNFPKPGDAHRSVEDPNYPTGEILIKVPETERRKMNIDQVEPNHPLLPLALCCLNNKATERPSADEVCERLATLKREERYIHSVEQTRGQPSLIHSLREKLEQKEQVIQQERISHDCETKDQASLVQALRKELVQKSRTIQQERADHESELTLKNERIGSLETENIGLQYDAAKNLIEKRKVEKERDAHALQLQKERDDYAVQLQKEKDDHTVQLQKHAVQLQRERDDHAVQLQKERDDYAVQLQKEKDDHTVQLQKHAVQLQRERDDHAVQLQKERDDYAVQLQKEKDDHTVQLQKHAVQLQRERDDHAVQLQKERHDHEKELEKKEIIVQNLKEQLGRDTESVATEAVMVPVIREWKEGEPVPTEFSSSTGTALVDGSTAYFSSSYDIYSLTTFDYQWSKLPPCPYECFAMAVINQKLTTIGGNNYMTTNNALLSFDTGRWKQVFPPMPTRRSLPAAVTTSAHLVVAGGYTGLYSISGKTVVEVLEISTLQWSTASDLPQVTHFPQMTLCEEHIYLTDNAALFSCSMEKLLESCDPLEGDKDSEWTPLADIPVKIGESLVSIRGQVMAIGGRNSMNRVDSTTSIHCYDQPTNSWSVIGRLPIPLSNTLAAVLPSNELIVVGGAGRHREHSNHTYITSLA